jgi:hypothetical protein
MGGLALRAVMIALAALVAADFGLPQTAPPARAPAPSQEATDAEAQAAARAAEAAAREADSNNRLSPNYRGRRFSRAPRRQPAAPESVAPPSDTDTGRLPTCPGDPRCTPTAAPQL